MNTRTFKAAIVIFGLLLCLVGMQFEIRVNLVTAQPSSTYPTATIFFPTNGTVYHTNTLGCSFITTVPPWTASPWGYSEWVTIYLDNQSIQTFDQLTSYTLTNLTDGLHSFEVEANVRYFSAFGTAYRSGSSTVNFIVQTQIQTPVPTIAPTTSANPSLTASLAESSSSLYFGNGINFTVSVEGGKSPFTYTWHVEYSLDSVIVEATSSPYYSTNTFNVGSHHIFVEVTDADNNTARTLTVEFNVLPASNLSPSPTLEPTPSPSVAEFPNWVIPLPLMAAAATMTIYFRRRKNQ